MDGCGSYAAEVRKLSQLMLMIIRRYISLKIHDAAAALVLVLKQTAEKCSKETHLRGRLYDK
jgi:hypothetical protein